MLVKPAVHFLFFIISVVNQNLNKTVPKILIMLKKFYINNANTNTTTTYNYNYYNNNKNNNSEIP